MAAIPMIPHSGNCLPDGLPGVVFAPVMRLHGDREPHDQPPMSDHGGGMCASGADNEVWSYGEEVYAIVKST